MNFLAQRKCNKKKLFKRERERLETSIKMKVLYQKMEKLKASRSLFWERRTDNGAFRGAVWNEKISHRVHCILGKLHTKNEGLKWYDKTFLGQTDGQCGLLICCKK